MAEPPVRVLYIAGAGRSGSTLLECLLNELPGVCAAGEVTHVWDRGFRKNELCGCGTPFHDCGFWRDVRRVAFGGSDVDVAAAAELRSSLCRLYNIPRLLAPAAARGRRFRARLSRYGDLLTRLYRAVAVVSGARVVVDSSKYPPEAFLLAGMGNIDLSILHVVRHSNAVAYAWQKWKERPDVHWTTAYMARYPFLKTAMAWNVFNALIESLGRRGVPYQRARYEDLVADPRAVVLEAARFLGIEPGALSGVREGAVVLGGNHTASGNPVRLRTGTLPLTLDTEWSERAPRHQRFLVNVLTSPLLRRYGYRWRDAGPGTHGRSPVDAARSGRAEPSVSA
ncbi:MAG TPA: hypothetical protein VFQ22_02880 [Longimicrobiales bacterium]|nr:hypothetical protein [Longimicrobiales bacterium]